ncbi:MAG: UDP-N-acetylmuramate--L-alanine ligase [Clostridia bacterium]|nr:UDP-N-acetylmuramate--L-alanine ligase [Clostridia bacterium]
MSKIGDIKKCHFIGVGGISMSALAKLMLLQGKKVTGSDLVYSKEMESLIEWGMDVWVGHDPQKIADRELIVYSAAVPEDDPELVYARENGIPAVVRHHFLGELAKDFNKVIAVSGTHGKTTTTGMLACIFEFAEQTFTAHLGGNIQGRGNLISKGYDYFITEACEYKKSMLSLDADIAIVLNVESDHPDTYGNEEELYEAFEKFIAKAVVAKGKAVINRDCHYYRMLKNTYENLLTYGIGETADVKAENINEYKNGYYEFLITFKREPIIQIKLSIPGHHNVYNALAAYSTAMLCGLKDQQIKKGIENFGGIERRFEIKGTVNKASVIIDYAHHPTEIKAAIATAKSLRPRRILTVFQPHTYSRTKQLYKDFLKCFEGSNKLYIFKEYSARETQDMGLTANELYKGLRATRGQCQYFNDIITLARAVSAEANEGDIILVLGAGDVALLGDLLVNKN